MSPEGSKVGRHAALMPSEEMVTRGVGDPDLANWALVKSNTVSELLLHRSPERSNATLQRSSSLMITWPAGEPDLASCDLVNSTASLLRFVTQRSPEGSKARPA